MSLYSDNSQTRGCVPMIRKIILLAPLLLTACAVAKPTNLPDGRQGLSISCDGQGVGMNVCWEKAGELCPRGYDIVNKEHESTPTGSTTWGRYTGLVGNYGATSNKSIMIACK